MDSQNQCVISLSKLTLPENRQPKKLTLSILSSSQEIFIQNHKNVKTTKVNFYRQSIFLASLPKQLSFNIYQVDDLGNKILMKQLKTIVSDLREIKLRPRTFRISDQGFILDWESWIFTEESQDLNEVTQRDYSFLDLPFKNEEQTNKFGIFKDQYLDKQKSNICHISMKKNSNSTDSSSSPEPERTYAHDKADSPNRVSNMENKCRSPNKQRNTIKSHLYSELCKIASELFSQSNS